MTIQINKAHFPVTVLGPGRRIAVWVQGCTLCCPGCLSRDTWAPDPTRAMSVADMLAWCRLVGAAGVDGVTISGGEPFQQVDALTEFLQGLHLWRTECRRKFDILCFSGFPLATLRAKHAPILRLLDAIIPEPFIEKHRPNRIWRGSANQPLVPLSRLGRKRYAAFIEKAPDGKGRFQVSVSGGHIWYVGIPQRGDLQALSEECCRRGIVQKGVSWRS
jgi:anaerobic ribonucleoside-triphosphate reductase activating protein